MPKRRTNKHRGSCNEHQAAWLEGNREAGFMVSLNHDFVLQELWGRCGNHDAFFWESGMSFPEPL
jgi:hypothetical protein